MKNIKKKIRVGLGLALLGTEKIPKLIKEMEARGEIGAKEAKKLIDDVWDITQKEAKEIDKHIDTKTKLKLMRFALKAKKDATEFRTHLEDLEGMIGDLIEDRKKNAGKNVHQMHKKISKKVKDTKASIIKHLNTGINAALDELMKE